MNSNISSKNQTGNEIQGKAKTIRELLKGVKYSIDYYQREYKWKDKQVRELIDDLTGKFLEEYEPGHPREKVESYPHYFLGSIIISKKDGRNYIVDGQQRLTSLTLLLIYLRNLQTESNHENQVLVDELIVSEKYGRKSFNMQVEERKACMEALYRSDYFDTTEQPESVETLYQRYHDIGECLPEEALNSALPYFIDWLLENVHLVEITAFSDNDAYTIFETMNDRGLSLSPTDMLKGYLLANITDSTQRISANQLWRSQLLKLRDAGKEAESDFFKAWFRSQYSTKIRERKKGAKPEDYDRIGTEFHRWVRDNGKNIGLKESSDYFSFIRKDFQFYLRNYLHMMDASRRLIDGYEHIRYNADHGFTLQYQLLLAPLNPSDSESETAKKINLVAKYIDILLCWRLWNFRSIGYSTMQYAMFLVTKEIRGLSSQSLAKKLHRLITQQEETFETNDRLYVHQQNRRYLHRILARITDFVETQSGQPTRYAEYVAESGRNRFEVEHIWADKPERHTDEFDHPVDFEAMRNRIGALLLLPKSFNASYGDLPYDKKLPHYNTQNLLARSLHEQCYDRNPAFLRFINETELPFHDHKEFKSSDIEERGKLYQHVAQRIWNPDILNPQ